MRKFYSIKKMFLTLVMLTTSYGMANAQANAGEDQYVNEGEFATLDGSNSIGDGLTFAWYLNGIKVGNDTTISTDTLSLGEHIFTLTTTDADNNETSDDVTITVEAVPVTADAGINQYITENFPITLDASASTGVDLVYSWRLNDVDVASTVSFTVDTLTTGEHAFALKVTDKHGVEAVDTVYVNVETGNVSLDFETMANDTAFADVESGKPYLVFDISNGRDKTNGDRLPETGAIPTLTKGVKGQAMVFDGTNDWVNVQYAYTNGGLAAKSNDFSTSVWFKADKTHTIPPKAAQMVIFDSPGFGLMIQEDTLYATAFFRDRDHILPYGSSLFKMAFDRVDEWTNVVMVFDGGDSETSMFKVYVNGELLFTDEVDVPFFYADWYDWTNIGATTAYASLAQNVNIPWLSEGDMGLYFSGVVDEFMVTRKAMTNEEIKQNYYELTPLELNVSNDTIIQLSEEVILGVYTSRELSSVAWSLNGQVIGTTDTITTDTLSYGAHMFIVEATDIYDKTDKDTVIVNVNIPPIANAGEDIDTSDIYAVGLVDILLNGGNSYDVDGSIDSYVWKAADTLLTEGIESTVSMPVGTHEVVLTVTDNTGATDTDTLSITISPNEVPTASAGEDQTVEEDKPVQLDGSSSYDPDGNVEYYMWIAGDTTIGYDVTAQVLLPVGVHNIILKVIDNGGASNTDTVQITVVANKEPIANAGEDQTVEEGKPVKLDGSGSYDPDGNIVSYEWMAGDTTIGYDVTAQVLLPVGIHNIILKVIDNGGASNTDTVQITVVANKEPIANAGENQTVEEGKPVKLDGSSSYDPDGTIVSYQWTLADTVIANTEIANIILPIGSHEIVLKVTDNDGASDMDTVVITINTTDGIKDATQRLVTIYPNPTTNGIYISADGVNETVTVVVTNIKGSIVINQDMNLSSDNYLNLQELESGNYIISILQHNNIVNTQTLIIK